VKIVLLAEHALMNVLLKQYQKVISIKLIRTYVLIAVLVLMYVRWRQFTPLNSIKTSRNRGAETAPFLFRIIFRLFKDFLNIDFIHKQPKAYIPVSGHIRFNYPETEPTGCPAR